MFGTYILMFTYSGSRAKTPVEPPKTSTTVPPVTVNKAQCTDRIGSAFFSERHQITYIFNGVYFYKLHKAHEGMGVEEGPLLVRSTFETLNRVDAVFRRAEDDALVFFHGDQ